MYVSPFCLVSRAPLLLYCRYNLNGAFIAAHEFLQCDTGWNSEVYHTYEGYVRFGNLDNKSKSKQDS